MASRMFGVETEYAYTALDSQNRCLQPESSIGMLLSAAAGRLPHLRSGMDSRMYLANGACMYIDCGLHPEYATPECTDPWEAVRHISAGERILSSLAEQMVSSSTGVSEALFLRSNVCYSTGATWGCHESYLTRADPAELSSQIIPHMVSRLVYTGAGGFDNTSLTLQFILSTRVPHMEQAVSRESTSDRGIFHTKNEPLCRGYNRLHVLCGESLCSQTAVFLKIGVTALVVAMIEAGLSPGDAVRFRSPLNAMREFSRDVTCRAEAEGLDGTPLTALQVQRHYLELAEANQAAPFMPEWAPGVCAAWRRILERLEGAPESVDKTLDWAMKHSLYRAYARDRGVEWNARVSRDAPGPASEGDGDRRRRRTAFYRAVRRGLDLQMPDPYPALGDPPAAAAGTATRADLAVRHQLCEIDMRFGQLGPGGLFTAMDASGVLDHRVAGIGDVDRAVSDPPAVGRARVRGEAVRRLSADRDRYGCSWERIVDTRGRRMLDLSDPWSTDECWRDVEARVPE